MTVRLLVACSVLALLVAAGCGGSGSAAQKDASPFRSEFEGAAFGTPKRLADFALRDQSGELVRLSAQRGRVVLVTFLYTRCPDVCPLIADNLNVALRELGQDRTSVRVLAVSVDPEGDTPRAVRAYVRRHRLLPEFRYLSGTQEELEPVWELYDVTAVARDPELVDHSAYTVLIDHEGRGRAVSDASARPQAFLHDVRLLLVG